MDYKEALKQVQATKKAKENFLVFNFGYNMKVVLPHKEGMVLLSAFSNAEVLEEAYKQPPRIGEMERDKLSISTLSAEEYDRYKIAALLGITPEEVKAAASPQPAEQQ